MVKKNSNNSTKNTLATVLVNGLPVIMSKSQVLDLLMTKNTTKLLVNEKKFSNAS